MLTGTELLIVHFRECSDNQLKLPFHIELEDIEDWDRSRTWVFTKHNDGLESDMITENRTVVMMM